MRPLRLVADDGADAEPPPQRNILESSIARVDAKWRLMVQMTWTVRRWRNLLDQRLRGIGHNGARMEALANIAYSPPDASQVELANRIGIERATITRMLDSLEADGLVLRVADPADRRIKRIRLTPAGEAALREIQAVVDDLREQVLRFADPAEIDAANLFLGQFLVQLGSGGPGRSAADADPD